ncbi:MAG: glycosyltransferase family 9 protein [Thiohalomonadaceae bacterium]
MKILVVRNDRLGDFMLAWPAFALLKQALPAAHIGALVPVYTAAMAELCPWIDEVVIDPGPEAGNKSLQQELAMFRADAIITLFSTTRIGIAAWRARIPYRLAPASKLAQVFYNNRLVQRRSRSEKPEWEYNLDLIRYFLADHEIDAARPHPPYLVFPREEIAALRRQFLQAHGITVPARLVLVHPGSGGSANNLSLDQYALLLRNLYAKQAIHFIIGCGPGEELKAETLATLLGPLSHSVLPPDNIVDYASHIAFADLFISGSTGPLHIAGALDIPTAGFYPRRRSATPLRWQTLNSPERRLAFTPPATAEEMDMSSIDVIDAARLINQKFI